MICEQPDAADLLTEARREFIEAVLPGIGSESRYKAAMVLRAMQLAVAFKLRVSDPLKLPAGLESRLNNPGTT